jgi:hypothetical protein
MNGGYVIDKSEFVILINQRLKYLKERKRFCWAGISERAPELRRDQNMLGDISETMLLLHHADALGLQVWHSHR